MAVFLMAFALDHLWSVVAAIYTAFDVPELFTFISLSTRFLTIYFVIAGMVFITWQFESNKDDKQK